MAANITTRRAVTEPTVRAEPPVNGAEELEPLGENGLDEDPRVPDGLILEGPELAEVVVGNGGMAVEKAAVEEAGRLLKVTGASLLEVEATGASDVAGFEAAGVAEGGIDVTAGAAAAHSHTAAAAD